jgi:NAD(P)-dependent dehydrogenase (short-subunit alcohol dehydrogenase family)
LSEENISKIVFFSDNSFLKGGNSMQIAIIDGQGGGIGKSLIEKIKASNCNARLIALGTNALATANMLKAGADDGATGENAIVFNAGRADVIMGAIGIISANSMLGELTPAMARAIAESPAPKILIPFNKCHIFITGLSNDTLQFHLEAAVKQLLTHLQD